MAGFEAVFERQFRAACEVQLPWFLAITPYERPQLNINQSADIFLSMGPKQVWPYVVIIQCSHRWTILRLDDSRSCLYIFDCREILTFYLLLHHIVMLYKKQFFLIVLNATIFVQKSY